MPHSITHVENFKTVPWDTAALGIPAYESLAFSPEVLKTATLFKGHYTVRVNPLVSKKLLNDHGFYYCDTLIEPYCPEERFIAFNGVGVSVTRSVALDSLLRICRGAFSYDRFHRDFNLTQAQADDRYNNWLAQLHTDGKVYGLIYCNELAGFIAVDGNKLVLHALAESMRGRGLAKLLWTPVCSTLFKEGYTELTSSISATNLAVMNLYARLGFIFRNPVDIYHRLTQ